MARSASGSPALAVSRGWLRAVPAVVYALVGLLLLLGVLSPRSVAPENLLNLTRQAAMLGLVALGQTIVMVGGGLDLSVGSMVILANVLAAQLMAGRNELAAPVALAVLVVGALVGAANGLLITRFRVTPFIATLGMNFVVYGAALVYSGGAPRGDVPAAMRFWGNGFLFGLVPAASAVWLTAAALIGGLLAYTRAGRELTATGANPRAAWLAGIPVQRMTVLSYIASGVMAAGGGVLLAAYVGTGTLEVGTDFLLGSIAAAVIGGTQFEGGRGTVLGTVCGALFLMTLYSILTVLNLPISGRRIVEGLIILAALALYARGR